MEYLLENGGDLTQFGGPRMPGQFSRADLQLRSDVAEEQRELKESAGEMDIAAMLGAFIMPLALSWMAPALIGSLGAGTTAATTAAEGAVAVENATKALDIAQKADAAANTATTAKNVVDATAALDTATKGLTTAEQVYESSEGLGMFGKAWDWLGGEGTKMVDGVEEATTWSKWFSPEGWEGVGQLGVLAPAFAGVESALGSVTGAGLVDVPTGKFALQARKDLERSVPMTAASSFGTSAFDQWRMDVGSSRYKG